MHYIIENAAYVENGQTEKLSFMIKDNEFRYINTRIKSHNIMKMEASTFLITPSFIFYAPDLPALSFEQFKTYFTNEYVIKGCGTIITNFTVNHPFEFDDMLRKKRTSLLNSPIDFVLSLKIHAKKITTNIVRKCKTEKIPIIFVEINNIKDLHSIPWGWVREASFPYNPVFIPVFPSKMKKIQQKLLLQKWTSLLEKEKILHHPRPLQSNKPLNEEIIKKIGLYPKKGILKVGGEISYNLFFMNNNFEHRGEYIYGVDLYPDVAVHKGKFISVKQKPNFRPGIGEEIIINKTALYV